MKINDLKKSFSEYALVLIYNIKNNKVLLQLRDKKETIAFPNTYAIPGGEIEKGESPISAAVREIKEETGYSLKKQDLLLFSKEKYISEYKNKYSQQFIYLAFYDNKQVIKCFEGQGMEFLSEDEVKKEGRIRKSVLREILQAFKIVKALNLNTS